jgi:hypothetical protein
MSNKKHRQNLPKQHKKPLKRQVDVRHLLGEACRVAGEISDICRQKTSKGELLNQNELSNLKVATDILKSTRESQLKAKALKQVEEERKLHLSNQDQPQLVQLDSATIASLIDSMKSRQAKPEVVDAEQS